MVTVIYALWRRGSDSDRPWLRWWANGQNATADAVVGWDLLSLQAHLGVLECIFI